MANATFGNLTVLGTSTLNGDVTAAANLTADRLFVRDATPAGVNPNTTVATYDSGATTNYVQLQNQTTGSGSGTGTLIGVVGQNATVTNQQATGNVSIATSGGSMTLSSAGVATFSSLIAAANATITGAISGASLAISGAITAASGTVSGLWSVGSLAATGAITAASGTVSGLWSVGSLAASGAISAASLAISGALTATSLALTGTLDVLGTSSLALTRINTGTPGTFLANATLGIYRGVGGAGTTNIQLQNNTTGTGTAAGGLVGQVSQNLVMENLQASGSVILESAGGTVTLNSAGATAVSGALSAASAAITAAVTAASAALTGALTAASGAFTGALTSATLVTTGDVTVGDQLLVNDMTAANLGSANATIGTYDSGNTINWISVQTQSTLTGNGQGTLFGVDGQTSTILQRESGQNIALTCENNNGNLHVRGSKVTVREDSATDGTFSSNALIGAFSNTRSDAYLHMQSQTTGGTGTGSGVGTLVGCVGVDSTIRNLTAGEVIIRNPAGSAYLDTSGRWNSTASTSGSVFCLSFSFGDSSIGSNEAMWTGSGGTAGQPNRFVFPLAATCLSASAYRSGTSGGVAQTFRIYVNGSSAGSGGDLVFGSGSDYATVSNIGISFTQSQELQYRIVVGGSIVTQSAMSIVLVIRFN